MSKCPIWPTTFLQFLMVIIVTMAMDSQSWSTNIPYRRYENIPSLMQLKNVNKESRCSKRHSYSRHLIMINMSSRNEELEDNKKDMNEAEEEEKSSQNLSSMPPHEYNRPKFSQSFLDHLEKVKGSDNNNMYTHDGVECTGEPSMDPSRLIQDDGLDSEYLNDFR